MRHVTQRFAGAGLTGRAGRTGRAFCAILAGGALAMAGSSAALAQQPPVDPPGRIIVNGVRLPDPAQRVAGPELHGVISARSADRIQITGADGAATVVYLTGDTQVRASKGPFGVTRARLGADALLNGLPVTARTWQADGGLVASQISFKGTDLKTATMIRHGTAQGFAEQTAATEALRGRLGDIDKYNIKSTANVWFDSGKALLSPRARADLCAIAAQAEATDNALMLVVGYTDATGSAAANQALSEKRAGAVINYLQQQCHWKPWRMLTPTGMATADPLADNTTPQGRAQNRRVAVNILVSKSLDGM